MKKTVFLIPLMAALACNQPAEKETVSAPVFDEAAEKTAIMKTIEAETDCFYRRDYACWKENFIQKNYAFQGWSNGDGTFDAKVGWPEVDKKIGDYIKNNPVEPGTKSHLTVERKNMVVKFFGDKLAYLVWDQYNSDREGKTFLLSKDQRIMEKEDGKWKIANVSSFWDYKHVIAADSIQKL